MNNRSRSSGKDNTAATDQATVPPATNPTPSETEQRTAAAIQQYKDYVAALDDPGADQNRQWVLPPLNPNLKPVNQ